MNHSLSERPKMMLTRIAAGLLAGTLSIAPVLADQAKPVTVVDPRIKYLPYGENTVYRLDLYLKSVSAIQFSDDEQVESILIGDSASWEVVKLKNGHVVSIKATIPSARTNMTVYTDRRVYTFEIQSLEEVPTGAGGSPLLRTVFTYPSDKKRGPATGVTPARADKIDSNYLVSGKAEFRPVWVQDNGRQTSFFLPDGAARPAIFKVGPKKEEQLMNSRTTGGRVVVDGVSDYWVLRIGDEFVCIARSSKASQRPHIVASLTQGGRHGQ